MTIPTPPAALPRPNIAVRRAGTRVHRVHARSRRPIDDACLFFGNRVHADDLRIIAARDGRRDPSFLADVGEAGRRADITVVI